MLRSDAASATTKPWHWMSRRLAKDVGRALSEESWCECAAVESLEASTISKLPLSPSNEGHRMNISDMPTNTGQCCQKGKRGTRAKRVCEEREGGGIGKRGGGGDKGRGKRKCT